VPSDELIRAFYGPQQEEGATPTVTGYWFHPLPFWSFDLKLPAGSRIVNKYPTREPVAPLFSMSKDTIDEKDDDEEEGEDEQEGDDGDLLDDITDSFAGAPSPAKTSSRQPRGPSKAKQSKKAEKSARSEVPMGRVEELELLSSDDSEDSHRDELQSSGIVSTEQESQQSLSAGSPGNGVVAGKAGDSRLRTKQTPKRTATLLPRGGIMAVSGSFSISSNLVWLVSE